MDLIYGLPNFTFIGVCFGAAIGGIFGAAIGKSLGRNLYIWLKNADEHVKDKSTNPRFGKD
jgi:hypothetical protein